MASVGNTTLRGLTTHTAESRLRHPVVLLRRMVGDLWASRHLAWEMFRRDIEGQYRQSILGVLMAFLPALVTAAWCTLIEHARVINVPELELPYPAFVLMSMMIWTTFVDAMNAPMHGLLRELRALARASFPAEAVFFARFLDVAFNFGVKSILIAAAVVWFGLPIHWTVIFSPVSLFLVILLGMAIGLALAPINALYRDVGSSLNVVTTFWLFLTPVLFPLPKEGLAAQVVKFNPVSPLLSATRELATTGHLTEPRGFFIMAVITPIFFLLSWIFFRIALPVVIDRTNA